MEKKYPIGGYAPGEYWHKSCKTCGKEFTGDKRAWNCEPCGEKTAESQEADRRNLTPEQIEERKEAIEWYRNPAAGKETTVFVPCEDDDPRCAGGYTSSDGQCLCHVRETTVPVIEQGAVWVKASERLPQSHEALFIKISKGKSVGSWHPHHEMFVDDYGDFHPADQVEWLDESAGEKEVIDLPAFVQYIRENYMPSKEIWKDKFGIALLSDEGVINMYKSQKEVKP